jgi:hypothetical protein
MTAIKNNGYEVPVGSIIGFSPTSKRQYIVTGSFINEVDSFLMICFKRETKAGNKTLGCISDSKTPYWIFKN